MCPVISRMLLCLPVVRLPQSHLLFTLNLFCFLFHVMDSKSNNSFNKDFAVLNKMASVLSNVHLTSMINTDV